MTIQSARGLSNCHETSVDQLLLWEQRGQICLGEVALVRQIHQESTIHTLRLYAVEGFEFDVKFLHGAMHFRLSGVNRTIRGNERCKAILLKVGHIDTDEVLNTYSADL